MIEADCRSRDAAEQFEETWLAHISSGVDNKHPFDYAVKIYYLKMERRIEENIGWMKVRYGDLVPPA